MSPRVGLILALMGGVASAAWGQEDPRVAQGKQLIGELNPRCTICHSIAGKGNPKGSLDDVGTRWKAEELKAWLRTPAEMARKHGKTRTPAMKPYPELEEAELDAVVAYLGSLKKPAN